MSTALDPDPRLARRRVRVGAVLMLLLVALGVAVLVTAMAPRGSTTAVADRDPSPVETVAPGLYVHVLGRVAAPGLYVLDDGARVVDAIAAAGGFSDDADPGAVNLARLLSDGEQLYVPAEGEAPPASAGIGSGGGLINLNSADAATLESLPRIGPALAERIVSWREDNGRFSAVDDLLAVSGIGEATLDGFRDLVTV